MPSDRESSSPATRAVLPQEGEAGGTLARWARRVVRSRLLHFALLGGAMFAIAPRQADPRTIRLGPNQVAAIWASDVGGRANVGLSPEERQASLRRFVDDELLYREGLRLGLAEDDRIVRNRVIQKMTFYSENLAGASERAPDARLREYYQATPERWQNPPEVRYDQLFVPRALHADDGAGLAERVRAQLVGDPAADTAKLARLGEEVGAFEARDEWVSQASLGRDLGDEFAAAVVALPAGSWSAVLVSPLGWHVVRVRERKDGVLRPFEDVRGEVALAYAFMAKRKAGEQTIERLRGEYRVEIEMPGGDATSGSGAGTVRAAESAAR